MRLFIALLSLCWCMQATASQDLERVRLQLKWTHQFQFAGYYAAQDQGFYAAAGLDVSVIEASPNQDPVAAVLSGEAEFGVGTSGLLLRRAQGQPLVVLAVIFQHSPLAILTLESAGIRNVHELAGQRLMIEDGSEELFAYLKREGVPRNSLTLLPHSFGTNELADGDVDAMSVYVTDEPFVFARDRVSRSLFTPRSAGIDFYGDNLFTTEAYISDHPEVVAAFREASLRGWEYAMAHPEEVIERISERYPDRKGRDQLRFEHEQTKTLLPNDLVPVGYMHPGRWRHIARVYAELGMLDPEFALTGFLYDPKSAQLPAWILWALAGVITLTLTICSVTFYILRINRRLTGEISRRAQIEHSLEASRQHYQLIYETAPLALIFFDRERCIADWNRAAEQIFGWTKAEMLGSRLDRMVPPAELAHVLQVMEQTWMGAMVCGVNKNLTRDGRTIICRWRNVTQRDCEGHTIGMLSLAEDITETQRVRDELETANRGLRRQIVQIEGLQEELHELTLRDPLTGLYNRRHLHAALDREFDRPKCKALCLVMIDIDGFKEVNDTLGHQAGDLVLVALARILTSSIPARDLACRYGGEEFVVVLHNTHIARGLEWAESLRRTFAELVVQTGRGDVRRTLSAGVAAWPEHAAATEHLLDAADLALYAAKRAGRDCTRVAEV